MSKEGRLKNNFIKELFQQTMELDHLSMVTIFAKKNNYEKKTGVKLLTRKSLKKILRNPNHRENTVPGSIFDLVQKKIDQEEEIDRGFKKAKKKGLTWRETCLKMNIGELETCEYMRLKRLFDKC